MDTSRGEIDVSKAYGIRFKSICQDENGHRLIHNKSKYLLKHVNRKEWEIISSASIVEYVVNEGFSGITTIKKSLSGKPYIKEDNKLFVLVDDREGERLELYSRKNAMEFAEILGMFHNAAEGFVQPTGVKVRVEWGKSMERLRTLTSKIEKYGDLLSSRGIVNEFEETTWKYVDMLIKRAKNSMKIFRSVAYLKALENSMRKKEICLNSISDKTAVRAKDGLIIDSIFDLGYNMIEEDVGELVKKVIGRTGDKAAYSDIINAYSNIRNLSEGSNTLIKGLVSYPYDSIKTINRYMSKGTNSEELLIKFNRYIEKEQRTDILGV